jgi:hypothetical protein
MAKITYYVTQFTFNSVTYDNSSGGTLRAQLEDGGREVETRIGGDLYPSTTEITDASGVATIGISELAPTLPSIGTKSNIVLTVQKAGGTTEDKTWYNMRFAGQSANQDRAASGTNDFRFVFESSDGVKGPTENPV